MINYKDLWDSALKQVNVLLEKFTQLEAENESLRERVGVMKIAHADQSEDILELKEQLWTVKAERDESRDESVALSMDHARLAQQFSEAQEQLAKHQGALVDERSKVAELERLLRVANCALEAWSGPKGLTSCNCLKCESLRR